MVMKRRRAEIACILCKNTIRFPDVLGRTIAGICCAIHVVHCSALSWKGGK